MSVQPATPDVDVIERFLEEFDLPIPCEARPRELHDHPADVRVRFHCRTCKTTESFALCDAAWRVARLLSWCCGVCEKAGREWDVDVTLIGPVR